MTSVEPGAPRAPVLDGGGVTAVVCLLAGLGALAIMIIAFGTAPRSAFHAYLAGYAFVLSMVLGSMAFVMISHAANATWPVAVRRIPEAVAAAMPVVALLFVPVLFGLRALYPWARLEDFTGSTREILEHRRAYMNPTAFSLRAICYLAWWSCLCLLLHRWSVAMERGADSERCSRKLRRLSYVGLPLGALTAGFAAYEWFMSLSPQFASTMFSALWLAVCLHAGVAITVLLVALASRGKPQVAAKPAHAYALGRLLFAFLIFLGYTAFFQFMLVWMANRPGEASWYLERAEGTYGWMAAFVLFGEFLLPFLALLSYRLKRNLNTLAAVAVWCLASLYVHLTWLITPAAGTPGLWLDIVALVAVLAPTVSYAIWRQRGLPLTAASDARYAAALAYDSR